MYSLDNGMFKKETFFKSLATEFPLSSYLSIPISSEMFQRVFAQGRQNGYQIVTMRV